MRPFVAGSPSIAIVNTTLWSNFIGTHAGLGDGATSAAYDGPPDHAATTMATRPRTSKASRHMSGTSAKPCECDSFARGGEHSLARYGARPAATRRFER